MPQKGSRNVETAHGSSLDDCRAGARYRDVRRNIAQCPLQCISWNESVNTCSIPELSSPVCVCVCVRVHVCVCPELQNSNCRVIAGVV